MMSCPKSAQNLKIIWAKCIDLNLRSHKRERATSITTVDREGRLTLHVHFHLWPTRRSQFQYYKLSVLEKFNSIFVAFWRFYPKAVIIWQGFLISYSTGIHHRIHHLGSFMVDTEISWNFASSWFAVFWKFYTKYKYLPTITILQCTSVFLRILLPLATVTALMIIRSNENVPKEEKH